MSMYICEKCHDSDAEAVGCDYSFKAHRYAEDSIFTVCKICGRIDECVKCKNYDLFIKSRSAEKRTF